MGSFTTIRPNSYTMYNVSEENIDNSYSYNRVKRWHADMPQYAYPGISPVVKSIFGNKHICFNYYKIQKSYENTLVNLCAHVNSISNPALSVDSDSSPYPIAVRYIHQNGAHFIERYPFKTQVTFSDSNRKPYITESENISIWIPWTISEMNQNHFGMKIYYSSKSLSSMSDLYVSGAMPNAYIAGNICWGTSLANLPTIFNEDSQPSFSTNIKSAFSILFNEYFSGGWNTDLGSHIYNLVYEIVSSSFDKDQFPMINRLAFPSNKYIKDHFSHIKQSRRNMISRGLLEYYDNRLKHGAYILYMLSSFTLEETLAFYQELSLITTRQNYYANSVLSFEKIVDNCTQSSSSSNYYYNNGTFDFYKMNTPPAQRNLYLRSLQQFDNFDTPLYVYYYNVPTLTDRSYGNYTVDPSSYHFIPRVFVGPLINKVFLDFIDFHYEVNDQYPIYMVDLEHLSYSKFTVPVESNHRLLSHDDRSLNAFHHAFSSHYNLSVNLSGVNQ